VGIGVFCKRKRAQGVFLVLLITFTNSSFPLSWGVIAEKACSYSVKSFNGINKFLCTRVGCLVESIMINAVIGLILLYAVKKFVIDNMFERSNKIFVNMHKKKEDGTGLTFKDDYIGDLPPAITTLMRTIIDRDCYTGFGVNSQKGILIGGPPGVGKTFLVKVLADEVDAEIYILDGARVKGGALRGSGSELVRGIFSHARAAKRHSIVLIDEFDAISDVFAINADEAAMKTLLTEMDGFHKKHSTNITVIGLTNSLNKLTRAMKRRFNTIQIDLPDKKRREKSFDFYVKKHMKLPKVEKNCTLGEVNFGDLASKTEGFSQDDLESVVNAVFTRVAEKYKYGQGRDDQGLASVEGKIKIGQEIFQSSIQGLKSQIELEERDFLSEPSQPMSEAVQHMYS